MAERVDAAYYSRPDSAQQNVGYGAGFGAARTNPATGGTATLWSWARYEIFGACATILGLYYIRPGTVRALTEGRSGRGRGTA